MDAHAFEPLPVIELLVAPAMAVRDGLAARSRIALAREDDGIPRGRLRADDAAAEPFEMSRHVVRPLAAATLTLDTILTGFEPQDGRFPALTRDYGMFPLIRSAMLHASRAIYLLQPPARSDRIGRLVALAREDAAVITRAQELMGACTCEASAIAREADLLAEERSLPDSWLATDTVVMVEAASQSTFGPPLLGIYEAIDCATRGLIEPFRSLIAAPLTLATPSGEKQFSVQPHEIHWVALAALADLVSIGWHLADLEEDADASAA